MTKKLIKETVEVDLYQFEGSLEDIIAMLQDWKEEGKWEGIEIDYYEGGNDYQLYKYREETLVEFVRRTNAEEYDKEKRRIQYEKLKKEFEE